MSIQESGTLEMIEDNQNHPHSLVYVTIKDILETYFQAEPI
jgi:hypothetical protein